MHTDPHPHPDAAILQALQQAAGAAPHSKASKASKADKTKSKASATSRPGVDFSAEGQLPLDAVAVAVQGHGPLGMPVDAAAAGALHQASAPALHGRRQATLLDTRVRDTGEIGADALTLQWKGDALSALMAQVAQALGLHRLEARLHNLLIYAPGQFFKPHQDTEKHRGMVATLVLVWPSAHIGGELLVRHGNETRGFASQHLQATGLRWQLLKGEDRPPWSTRCWSVASPRSSPLTPAWHPQHPPSATPPGHGGCSLRRRCSCRPPMPRRCGKSCSARYRPSQPLFFAQPGAAVGQPATGRCRRCRRCRRYRRYRITRSAQTARRCGASA